MNNCTDFDCEELNGALNESLWTLPISVTSSALTATVYGIILLVALIFNPLLMVFIIREKKFHQPSFIFLFCLLVIDFLEAFLAIPFYVTTHILHGWKFGDTDEERQMVCDMAGFFLSAFLSVSVYILGIISFDRFFYIVCAFRYKRYMKPWVAWVLVIGLCSVPVIVSALPLVGFNFFSFNQDFGACLFRWRGQTAYVILYSLVSFLPFVLIFVFTTITCCYVRRFISGTSKTRAKFTMRQDSKIEERAKQNTLTRLFAILLVTQIICFAPAFLTAFIGARFSYYIIPSQLFLIDFILVLSNAAINPIIQSLVWKKLRMKLCFCLKWKNKCCQSHDHDQVFEGSSSNSSPRIQDQQVTCTGLTCSMDLTSSTSKAYPRLNGSLDYLNTSVDDLQYSVKITDVNGSHTVINVTETVV